MSNENTYNAAPDMQPGDINKVGNPFFNRLPVRFRWTVHNLIAHPLSEILFQFGFARMSEFVHDWTMPEHES